MFNLSCRPSPVGLRVRKRSDMRKKKDDDDDGVRFQRNYLSRSDNRNKEEKDSVSLLLSLQTDESVKSDCDRSWKDFTLKLLLCVSQFHSDPSVSCLVFSSVSSMI